MEASVEAVILFEGDSLSCRVTKRSTVETLKNSVCDRWTVLNPWSIRFVLHGQCNQLYVDTDFVLQSVFERYFMRGVASFRLHCERLSCSPSSCSDPIPSSTPGKNPTTSLPKRSRVVSPVSKDVRAKKFFEGSQAGVKPKKNHLWEQAITGVRQIFYHGVQEVKNVVDMVCYENVHETDSKKRKSEPS
ncbi:hypothetical protein MKX03_013645, partial [Papaver bracteatum]